MFCENFINDEIHITGEDVNHIKNVLRMSPGDSLFVSDGGGRDVIAVIKSFTDDEIICEAVAETAHNELPVKIVLYQGLPKSDKMELIIQKCIELGVHRIVPVETQRCVVKLDEKGRYKKLERWRKIAESAAKQSQRGIVPEIAPVMSLEEAIEEATELSRSVFAYENADDPDVLKTILEGAGRLEYDSLGIFVGPEGGWEPSEANAAGRAGIELVTLGQRILRTETAGMALISAVMMQIEAYAKPASRLAGVVLLSSFLLLSSPGKAYATMSLETGASVGGISVALNNLYARSLHPERTLVESVKMAANGTIVVDEEKKSEVTRKLVESTQVVQEEIITEQGTTYGTVKGTASLRLRDNPSQSGKTLTLLAQGESYVVTEQNGDFLKVLVDEDLEGWVFKEYIDTVVKLDSEITAEEKAAQLAEAEKRKAEAELAMKALEEAKRNSKQEETTKAREETTKDKTEETIKPKETQETIKEKPEETTKAKETKPETVEAAPETETTKAKQEDTTKPKETERQTVEIGPGAGNSVNSATRNAMVAYAKQYLGNAYVYGGTDIDNGVDCSGFTQAIYKHFGYSIGRTSRDQAAQSKSIEASSAQPGDLFFYDSSGTVNHVAMYIGNGQVIHASSSTTGIIISNAYYRTPCKVGRFID